MKSHFIRNTILLALILFGVASVRAGCDYPIYRFTDENGKRTGYFLSSERLAATPEWVFDGTTPPPLSLPDAYRIANQWITQKHPKIDSFRMRSYAVVQAGHSSAPNRWYYTVDFVGIRNGAEVYGGLFMAMILMDGTIVEPREMKSNED